MISPYKKVNPIPFNYTMSLIGGKWKMQILFWLWHCETMRYGELKRSINKITHKMLANSLKELEASDLIIRTEYPQIPPKVEYSLSEKGQSLMPILHEICMWGNKHKDEISEDFDCNMK